MPVSKTLVQGYPHEWFRDGHFEAEVQYYCDWDSRYALAAEFDTYSGASYANAIADGPSGALCWHVTIKPAGAMKAGSTATAPIYDDPNVSNHGALVTLFFTTKVYGENMTIEELTPWSEPVGLDPNQFMWGDGEYLWNGTPVVKYVRGCNYNLTFIRAAALPAYCLSYVGCVNNAAVASYRLGLTFPQYQLLYAHPASTYSYTFAGATKFKITYSWIYREADWNKIWRAQTQAWEYVYPQSTPTTPHRPHPPVNFSALVP